MSDPIIPLIEPIAMGISTLPSTDSIAVNIEELKNTLIKNGNNLQTGLSLRSPEQSLRLIVPFIIALLPEIIKTMPDETIQIKHLINSPKLDPSLFDMDLFVEK